MQQIQAHNDGNASAAQFSALPRRWTWSRLCAAIAVLIAVTGVGLALVPGSEATESARRADHDRRQAALISALVSQRLIDADQLSRLIASALTDRETSAATLNSLPALNPFSSVALIKDGKATVVLKGQPPALAGIDKASIARIAEGRSSFLASHTDSGDHLVLLRAISTQEGQVELLLSELSASELWRSVAYEKSQICILNSGAVPVLCSPGPSGLRISSGEGANGLISAAHPGFWLKAFARKVTITTSPLAVDANLGVHGWSIEHSEYGPAPISILLSQLVYVLVGIVSVLAAGLLAFRLTRRQVATASQAMSTRRNESGARTNTRKDKADQPTPSQDINSRRLKEHAGTRDARSTTLGLLSEIDRAILSGATFERILDSVFERICAILPGDTVAVALLDREKPSQCEMIITRRGGKRRECRIEEALDARSTAELALIPDGAWFDCNADDALLAPLEAIGMRHCLLFPIFKDGVAAGALIVANETERSFPDRDYSLARDMAHRLGVAYTSSSRGQELLFHSLYDTTTELPNRKFFETRLEEEISRARRESRFLALLIVDLDNFKKINDTYGHEGGDILLEQASARLRAGLRSEDLVARVGSDEFAVLLPTLTEDTDAANVAEKLIESLSQPYALGSQQQHLSATIGIAVFPRDGQTSRAMLQSADFALHAAKKEGGAKYSAYEAQRNEQAQDQVALANDLRHAITKSELKLYFQPQIDLQHGEIVGAEALVRWQHRTRGMVMPGAFINIAEQSDLIEKVGEFVRQAASAQFRAWEKDGLAPMRVSVNVSSREVKRQDFVERIENTLVSSGLRPFSLELEITESLLLENADDVLSTLKALSDRGVRIAIDDFGTGYSSMAYLKNLPFHVLKIDQSFVKDIGTSSGADSIVGAIIGVAQSLGKEIVAEGIELDSQRAFLKENGCDMGQGYLWSRPVPADEFASFVRNWNNTARRVAAVD